MTVLGVLQARTSSTRLPGKVMLPLLGKPMLARQLERLSRATMLNTLVVATSTDPQDDALVAVCAGVGVPCVRGALHDVLDRFYQAALPYTPTHVVRLTGDCPLADAALIDAIIKDHVGSQADYTSNVLETTYPDGLDVEVVRFACLQDAWQQARLPSQREHVTPFIHQQSDRFHIRHYRQPSDWSHLRWTVDEPADYALITAIYDALYPTNPAFTTEDVMRFLADNPQWSTYNTHHQRNEGYQTSLQQDRDKVPFIEVSRPC
jgi:spore coat polysaccharide biosynthesis protein SpsF (cytidylyltransferase family)